MEKIQELRVCVESLSKEADKFFKKNNQAAGIRARKKLQKCKKLCQEIRKKIQKTRQENVQEKSAEISALVAVNGGNSLKAERFFQETTFLPPPDNLYYTPLDTAEIFSNPNFTIDSGEILYPISWEQENSVEIVSQQTIDPPEHPFFPSFED